MDRIASARIRIDVADGRGAVNDVNAHAVTVASPALHRRVAMSFAAAAMIGALAVAPSSARAQPAEPTHRCTPPMIPTEILDRSMADRVQMDLNTYKQCIQDFAAEHRAIAERHNNAANKAIDDYNQFVTTKLPARGSK